MNAKSRFGYDHSAFRRAVDVLTVSGLSYVRPFLLLLVLFVFANLNVARFSGGGRFITDFKFIRTCVEGACHLFLLLLDSCVGRFRTVKWHFELVFVDWRALSGIKVRGEGVPCPVLVCGRFETNFRFLGPWALLLCALLC